MNNVCKFFSYMCWEGQRLEEKGRAFQLEARAQAKADLYDRARQGCWGDAPHSISGGRLEAFVSSEDFSAFLELE